MKAETLATPLRTSIVRGLAERRQVFEHREEIDHLLDRVREADSEDVRRLAFADALALATNANRRRLER